MRFTIRLLTAALMLVPVLLAATDAWQERPDWGVHFEAAGVSGTIVVLDERSDARWVHEPRRAATRYLPASTFKIPHALFTLDAGVVRDEFQLFAWDGEERPIASWNRHQDLRSSMRNSVPTRRAASSASGWMARCGSRPSSRSPSCSACIATNCRFASSTSGW